LPGQDDEDDPSPTAISAPIDADVSSGCWTAENRSLPVTLPDGSQGQQWKSPPAMVIDVSMNYIARVETDQGTFEMTLLPELAPNTVNNFVCLAWAGYYDNTTFHRIISGFVIQGGDPTATGAGNPGYSFDDEPVTQPYTRGTVAMANSGANTNGSQFFVSLADGNLAPNYTIFGQVSTGMDVVDKIASFPTADSQGVPLESESVPVHTITITEVPRT
jgi:cyclophilin family peptidyl-prolyl cis-trans isomerase